MFSLSIIIVTDIDHYHTGEFDGDIDIDSRRGYCIVNRQFGGVPNIASDVDINANFPIVEMFPDLGLYIEAFFEEEGLTSPVSLAITL